MGLASFHGPHLLILDEPTNHLDIDSRAALIEAINDYQGAIILVSHDRYLLEACADRLWLVEDGTVKNFDGDMDDYKKYILDRASGTTGRVTKKERLEKERLERERAEEERLLKQRQEDDRTANAKLAILRQGTPPSRKEAAPLKKKIAALDEKMKKFQDLLKRIDQTLADPKVFKANPAKAAQLSGQRAELERALVTAEEEWLELTSDYDAAMNS
jgi:ATP-binding cassette subfamily F protein 3